LAKDDIDLAQDHLDASPADESMPVRNYRVMRREHVLLQNKPVLVCQSPCEKTKQGIWSILYSVPAIFLFRLQGE
jgi:hypothetical protein